MKYLPIGKIKENPKNPRTITDANFEKLVKSIKEFPKMLELRPLVVDENNIVLGGNMRLKACKKVGLKKIPVICVDDLTEEQKEEFIIKDNVGFGDWDWMELDKNWDSQKMNDWGLAIWTDVDTIEKVDESEEYIGMPDFEVQDSPFKVTINFATEGDREKFAKEYKMEMVKKTTPTWTTWWPFKDRDDLASVKFEDTKDEATKK